MFSLIKVLLVLVLLACLSSSYGQKALLPVGPMHNEPPAFIKEKLKSKHRNVSPLADGKKYVRFIYLVPADSLEKPEYKTSIANAAKNLQQWYKAQLSNNKSFNLYEPIVEVHKSSHPSSWYSTNPETDWAGQWKFWFNVVNDAFSLSGGSYDDPDNFWVVYVDALPVCPFLQGGGLSQVAAMGANDLRGLVGKPWLPVCDEVIPDYSSCRYVGGLGHELGHAFGLPHPPGCDDGQPVNCDFQSIMFLGYLSYPDTYFSENEKATLNSSAFIGEVTTGNCQIECSDLTNTYSYSGTVDVSICNGDAYLAGGSMQTTEGTYRDSFISKDGCDSIVFTKLKIIPAFVKTKSVSICQGDTYLAGGKLRTLAGVYTDTLVTIHGCDSIIVTTLKVNAVYKINKEATICKGDSYLVGTCRHTTPGTYADSLQTKSGCDSVIVTKLKVVESYRKVVDVSICKGATFFAGGALRSEAGTYVDTLNTRHGCDSIIVTKLNILPLYRGAITVSICKGERYFAGGQLQTAEGTYVDEFKSVQGCDSLVTTKLNVVDIYQKSIAVSICPGETYFAGGHVQSAAGTYTDSLHAVCGCDSTIVTHLTIFETQGSVVEKSICEGETYLAGGKDQDKPGTYYDTLHTVQGCDSVVVTKLTAGICTAIEEELRNAVQVYPVPTNQILYIVSDKIHHVELFNAVGQCVFSTQSDFIDFSLLPEGYYYVNVYLSPTESVRRRVIKSD